ncbi:SDR family oxidoreductase [Mobilicoccus caccae]|uniref:Dehydrogenase n=1 Tax=Mobilicoccus caccae TaxID=1859295 RepID=A0ABQ6IUC0_9MICO|nr:SDR family oxidoreductase [Mobilicoccus caccae]GMA40327.1 dehydrogenase [Mobilicoccus caccae]
MDLDGAGVVVTGAARGIGEAIARRLHAGGARLVLADRDAAELQALADELGAHAVAGDVASDAGVATLVAAARNHLGRIDVFYANAGIGLLTGLAETTDEQWEQVFAVNVMAHVRAARHLLPVWEEQGGGRFVVTASAAGLLTMLGDPSYSASKHAAVGFAEWLSASYRHRGVVVQAICPQGVATRMLDGSGGLAGLLSHDRALAPAEVAEAAAAALDSEAFYVLPHPEVADYSALRATDPDRWLTGMNKLQRKFEAAST